MNNLRKFNWITQYNNAKEGEELVKPSVSLVIDKAVVIYDDDIHIQYRWVNLDPDVDYICDTSTFTKYYKQKKQQSNDGYTWTDVVPAEYRRGDVYQTKSRDCGYMPKLYATYLDGREYELQCNGYSILTTRDTRPSGYNATAMTTAAIGDCITILQDSVFSGCINLEKIIIPTGITEITQWVFKDCTKLKRCIFDEGSQLTDLGLYTFSGCTSLEEFDIPSGVTEIKYECFENCTSLSSVTIPNSVTKIVDSAFKGCSSLISVNIPSGVTSIGDMAFYQCSGLTSVIVNAITPPDLGISAFNGSTCPIYVPAQSVNAYKTQGTIVSGWNKYASRIRAIPNS